jgi:hypothetical protein
MNDRTTHKPAMRAPHPAKLLSMGALLLLFSASCSSPGAIAPSTIPISGKYVALGGIEEASSCGLMVLVVPVKHPKSLSDLIDDLIKEKGGDALIEVSSSSSFFTALVYTQSCIDVRGKVVKFSR